MLAQEIHSSNKHSNPGGLFIFLGSLPYSGKTLEMLQTAQVKHNEGERVYISGTNSYVHSKPKQIESIISILKNDVELTRHHDCLASDENLEKVIEEKPDIVVIGSLIPAGEANMILREERIQKLLNEGVDVYTSLNVYQIEGVLEKLPQKPSLNTRNFVSLNTVLSACEIKVIDISSFQAIKILKETPIAKQYPYIGDNVKFFVKEENLDALRQNLLAIAVEHSKEAKVIQDLELNYTKETIESIKDTARIPYFKTFMYDNLIALMIIIACTCVNSLVDYSIYFDIQVKTLIYLTGVVATTLFTNIYTGILAVILTYLTYNYFFIPPIFTISIYNFPDIATALVFGFCAILINFMTQASFRKISKTRAMRDVEGNLSSDFLKETVRLQSIDKIIKSLASVIEGRLGQNVSIAYLADDSKSLKTYGEPINEKDLDLLKSHIYAQKNKDQIINLQQPLNKHMVPIKTYNGLWGALVFNPETHKQTKKYRFLVDSISQIAASAIEKQFLDDLIQDTLLDNEREKYRSALLSSISHDLKTPLVGIMGALSTIRSYRDKISQDDADDLLESAIGESKRLNQFITNILEISKIEAGHLNLKKNWVNLSEVCNSTISRFKMQKHGGISFQSDFDYDVFIDPVLIEQVIFNFIDNAIKYAGNDKPIEITAEKGFKAYYLRVQDYGKGIDEEHADKYFDKFYRHNFKDNVNAGTGLGLAICKGTLQAHDFDIKVYNRKDEHSGAVFEIIIPKEYIKHAGN
jgi:K+-sensing histidine kinase KdpD